MPPPSVSIVVPAYNAAPHLERCVDCIAGQDVADLEIIVVDDGSTDGTLSLLEKLAGREPRLRIVTHSDHGNHGVAATRNRALSLAQGAFVWFVDADDRPRPGAAGRLLQTATRDRADVVAFNAVETGGEQADMLVFRQPKPATVVTGEDWLAQCSRQKESRHYVWQRFYRRAYLEGIDARFREGIVHEDIAWITETDLRAPRFRYLDDILYDYVRNPGSLTRTQSDAGLLHRAESLVQVAAQLQEINRRCAMQPSTRRLLQSELVGQGVQVEYLRRRLTDPALRDKLAVELGRARFWRSLWRDAVTYTRKRQLLRIMLRNWMGR